MSYDFATARACSHTIVDEVCALDDARVSFRFASMPASSHVTVRVDGVSVPRSGLYSHAEAVFSNSEPYRIVSGESDLIAIRISNGPTRILQLNPGTRVWAKDLAQDLATRIPDLTFEVRNGRVVARSPVPVKGTMFTLVDPRWTDRTSSLVTTRRIIGAYSELGIAPGRVAAGRRLLPGWNVAALDSGPGVVFADPLPNASPVVTVTYQTLAQACNRCQGTRIEYDYTVSGHTYETVRDTDLLAQEFDKFMFTRLGSHWKWRWLGSAIVDRVGGKNVDGSSTAFVTVDMTQAFAVYQNIKQQQATELTFQNVSDAEYPLMMQSFDVTQDANDPTVITANMVVQSKSREVVPLRRTLSLPDPFHIASGPTATLDAGGGFRLRG